MTAKTDAERQSKCRAKKKERLSKNGGRVLTMEIYQGTDSDIKYLMEAGGFEDEKEMLTILIRNAKAAIEVESIWRKNNNVPKNYTPELLDI